MSGRGTLKKCEEPSKTFVHHVTHLIRHVYFQPTLVLSLTRPNFLIGAIIDTWFQTSLPAPPETNLKNTLWPEHEVP